MVKTSLLGIYLSTFMPVTQLLHLLLVSGVVNVRL